ncbi:DDB1- and CUL4-associated factor 4-like [Glandiceps talaboti]
MPKHNQKTKWVQNQEHRRNPRYQNQTDYGRPNNIPGNDAWGNHYRGSHGNSSRATRGNNIRSNHHWQNNGRYAWSNTYRGNHGDRQSETTVASTSSSGSQAENNDDDLDILFLPGFYYDREKKKYFRLIPGHNNYNPLTADTIQKKELEKKKAQFSSEQSSGVDKSDRDQKSKLKVVLSCKLQMPIFRQELQVGRYSPLVIERLLHERVINKLKLKYDLTAECEAFYNGRFRWKPRTSILLADDTNKKLFISLGSLTAKLPPMFSSVEPNEEDPSRIHLQPFHWRECLFQEPEHRPTNACWVNYGGEEQSHVLYSYFDMESRSTVRLLKYGHCDNARHYRYDKIDDTIWTCAWSNNIQYPGRFCIGLDKCANVIDIATNHKLIFPTQKSAVFAQTFATKSPLLFNGTRRGQVLTFDLRSSRHSTAVKLQHKSSVSCMRLLKDENYLVASDMDNKILLWDLRKSKQVLEYSGHSSNFNYRHIPFYIDSTETVLYAGGQDTFVRFWRLKDGHKLHTIATPADVDGPPAVQYSRHWTDHNIPGLLMACNEQLKFYTL